ncbi:alpha/beta hydrolase family protein [Myroides sp. LJL116]
MKKYQQKSKAPGFGQGAKMLSLAFFALGSITGYAQKKPLDHSLYDQWETIGNKAFTNDGKWLFYQVNQQQGDATLYLKTTKLDKTLVVDRGESAVFTGDSKFAVFSIVPTYEDLKQVRIKKKKQDEIARDSIGIVNLQSGAMTKYANIKSFKVPEKNSSYLAYLLDPITEKSDDTKDQSDANSNDTALVIQDTKDKKSSDKKQSFELIVENLITSSKQSFENVSDYYFDSQGKYLVFVTKAPTAKKKQDKKEASDQDQVEDKKVYGVYALDLKTNKVVSILENQEEYSQFAFAKNSANFAFIANNDPEKTLDKTYSIYQSDFVSPATLLADNKTSGLPQSWVISPNYKPVFSENSSRVFLGIAPALMVKDTTLIQEDHAIVDIWHFNEDVLQTQQLANLEKDLKKSYLATIDLKNNNGIVALGDQEVDQVQLVDKGDANFVLGSGNMGYRIQRQWDISPVASYYLIDVTTGKRTTVVENLRGQVRVSPKGQSVVYFNSENKNWYAYNVAAKTTKELNKGLEVSFADELNDMPDLAGPYRIQGWTTGDESVLIRDRYDIWEFALNSNKAPRMITNGYGRKNHVSFDLMNLDQDKVAFTTKENLILAAFNTVNKKAGFFQTQISSKKNPVEVLMQDFSGFTTLFKAKDAVMYGYLKGSFAQSNNLYITTDLSKATQVSDINKQQALYNWGTAELVEWVTPKGFESQGVLFKPEDFEPNKKYPMIVYFYERLSDNLHRYEAPAPTPSRLNIPFFVSNGYLVFTPDIAYMDGYPGKSAEEYINSGVDYLKQNTWVDGQKIGIQGQSWGGYQVTHLITVTDMYAAAWAGAPVVNMTSAYGGIRWTTGMSRQFQYEKTQSRLGGDLWNSLDLYMENSPLFNMPKVTTPVVIMHNDQDGAVPWYQGIEMFMALRRLGKPAWLLNYNGDDHNLIKRQNRKDIQIRQQQFFDYYLKGAKAPVWMVKGVPAINKGKDWGFELTQEKVPSSL